MTYTKVASIPTKNASRYLQQLCKHWSHNLSVSFDAEDGQVTFPKDGRGASWPGDATLRLKAGSGKLDCTIEATSEGQLHALESAVERHLDRFAFREAPLKFAWRHAD